MPICVGLNRLKSIPSLKPILSLKPQKYFKQNFECTYVQKSSAFIQLICRAFKYTRAYDHLLQIIQMYVLLTPLCANNNILMWWDTLIHSSKMKNN